MKVMILTDWFDTLRHLPCFSRLAAHDVIVLTEHFDDEAELVRRLHDAEALVLIREWAAITASLVGKLLRLKHQPTKCLPAHGSGHLHSPRCDRLLEPACRYAVVCSS